LRDERTEEKRVCNFDHGTFDFICMREVLLATFFFTPHVSCTVQVWIDEERIEWAPLPVFEPLHLSHKQLFNEQEVVKVPQGGK
jgi:hypothetical protein